MLERIRQSLQRWRTKLVLLYALDVHPEEGVLHIGEERVMIPPAMILTETRERIVNIGPAGRRFLYETGKDTGKAYAEAIEQSKDTETAEEELADLCASFGSYTGWGRFNVVEEDFDTHEFTVVLHNTPFLNEREEKTGEYHAGMLAGAAEHILDTGMEARETACENARSDHCRFAIGPEEEVDVRF